MLKFHGRRDKDDNEDDEDAGNAGSAGVDNAGMGFVQHAQEGSGSRMDDAESLQSAQESSSDERPAEFSEGRSLSRRRRMTLPGGTGQAGVCASGIVTRLCI